MNRLGLKILCFVAALAIWIQVASTVRVTADLDLPLRIVNRNPATTIAGNQVPATVEVRLEGSKLRMLAHRIFGRPAGIVEIDVSNWVPGVTVERPITDKDVESEMDVVEVRPVRALQILVDRKLRRRLPVAVVTTGKLPADRYLRAPPVAEPDSVDVRGPARFLDGVTQLLTEPVDLDKLRETSRIPRPVVAPSEFLTPTPAEVTAVFQMGPLAQRTLSNVSIVPLVDAGQPEVSIFPPVAELVVRGPADSLADTSLPSRVVITVPLTGLGPGLHQLPGQVIRPDWLEVESQDPELFEVRIGAADSTRGHSGDGKR